MKRMIVLFLVVMNNTSSPGQGLGNIFSQNAADLKSIGKQIVLLQLYMGWIEKGYDIARSGLRYIGEMKQGELNLHRSFLGSLASVNPDIKRYAEVTAVMEYSIRIIEDLKKISSIKTLTADEMHHLLTIKENLLRDCADGLDNLMKVVSDRTYRMTDGERIISIDGIYQDMKKNWVLVREFIRETNWIVEQRQWETQDVQSLKNLE